LEDWKERWEEVEGRISGKEGYQGKGEHQGRKDIKEGEDTKDIKAGKEGRKE
jgi:hypothetical protein